MAANEEKTVVTLSCSFCNYPVAASEEVMMEKFQCWEQEVYAYPLAMLEQDEIWCYSATNPSKKRFDVVRVKANPGIATVGSPTLLHTWFPAFAWNMASCVSCGAHLGWGFYPTSHHQKEQDQDQEKGQGGEKEGETEGQQETSTAISTEIVENETNHEGTQETQEIKDDDDDEEEGDEEWCSMTGKAKTPLAFIGLISTHCREEQYPESKFLQLRSASHVEMVRLANEDFQKKLNQCYLLIRNMTQRFLANVIGMELYTIQQDFSLRHQLSELWASLFHQLDDDSESPLALLQEEQPSDDENQSHTHDSDDSHDETESEEDEDDEDEVSQQS
jgi:hypothetical protein